MHSVVGGGSGKSEEVQLQTPALHMAIHQTQKMSGSRSGGFGFGECLALLFLGGSVIERVSNLQTSKEILQEEVWGAEGLCSSDSLSCSDGQF